MPRSNFSVIERRAIWEAYNKRCAYCEMVLSFRDLEIDHVVPQSLNEAELQSLGLSEHIVNLHIEKLPEGVYLATSGDVPGLVTQGRTIAETIEIARNGTKKLIEVHGEGAAGHSALAR